MLIISPKQLEKLNAQINAQNFETVAADVLSTLRETASHLVSKHSADAIQNTILEVVVAASAFGIIDRKQLIDWVYIRLATNVKFFEGSAFKFILTHPFLHSYAKGRHVIMAYFRILELEQQRLIRWPQ